jgi:outer membrane protein assembly factor BamD (BamD/ComL family)
MADAYRQLGMTDLAENVQRVYADNYPGAAHEIEPKKSWWRRFL